MDKKICKYCGEEITETESLQEEEDGLICESCVIERTNFLLSRM